MRNKFKNFATKQKNDNFCSYQWSDRVIKRGKQTFAIFGNVAYDVTKQKFNYDKTCVPGTGKLCAPINNRYLAQFPDEGSCGIMGLYIVERNNKKIITDPTFVHCGWLYTNELDLTNAEIIDNIINDIDSGKNVLTQKPAGWI